MIEIRQVNSEKNTYQLYLNGLLIESASIIGYGSPPKDLSVRLNNRDASLKAASHRFSEIPSSVTTLYLSYWFDWADLPVSVSITRKSGMQTFGFSVSYVSIVSWKGPYSYLEYIEELARVISAAENPRVKINLLEDGPLADELIFPDISTDVLIADAVENCSNILSEFHQEAKTQLDSLKESSSNTELGNPELERIVRSIEFPPEYHRSGISILSYFADVLRQKNLSEDVKVSIEQSGLNVRLIIESPTGQRELIEHTLNTYALVVVGKRPVEELTTDPYEVIELRSQLRIANAQLQNQRDMLELKSSEVAQLRSDIEENRISLRRLEQKTETETVGFMALIERLVTNNTDLASGFRELAEKAAESQNKALAGALTNLYKIVERGVREDDREDVLHNLQVIKDEDSSFFKRVTEALVTGSITGVTGNYLYTWVQLLIGSLPK